MRRVLLEVGTGLPHNRGTGIGVRTGVWIENCHLKKENEGCVGLLVRDTITPIQLQIIKAWIITDPVQILMLIQRQNEVFDPIGSKNWKDRDVSMAKTKADEKDLEAKEEQMTLLMSGDLTTESKQLTEGRKEETNMSLEYTSDMKKARLHSTLVALLNDPVLADLPKKTTLTDVDTLINLELGSAMRISILKLDGSSFDVTVMNSATVKDLKQAIRKRIDDTEQSKMGHRHISCYVAFLSS